MVEWNKHDCHVIHLKNIKNEEISYVPYKYKLLNFSNSMGLWDKKSDIIITLNGKTYTIQRTELLNRINKFNEDYENKDYDKDNENRDYEDNEDYDPLFETIFDFGDIRIKLVFDDGEECNSEQDSDGEWHCNYRSSEITLTLL
jgi:hypothetical protein